MNDTTKKPIGFALMTPEQRSANAQKGGRTAHKLGKAHTWDSKTAQEAGRKGGKRSAELRYGKIEEHTTK